MAVRTYRKLTGELRSEAEHALANGDAASARLLLADCDPLALYRPPSHVTIQQASPKAIPPPPPPPPPMMSVQAMVATTGVLTVANVIKHFGRDLAMDFAERIIRRVEGTPRIRKPTRVKVTGGPSPYHEGGGIKAKVFRRVFDTKICANCRRTFISARADAVTCSPKCRTALHRKRHA